MNEKKDDGVTGVDIKITKIVFDFDKALKLFIVVGALFVAFLWSGGVWEVKGIGDNLVRTNKITGAVDYGYSGEWKPIK